MPYKVFALIVLANIVLLSILEQSISSTTEYTSHARLISIMLCLILLAQKYWPNSTKKFIPLFWYFTAIISVPALSTFSLFQNKQSLLHLFECLLSSLILVILFDWLIALFCMAIGLLIGASMSYYIQGELSWYASETETLTFLYVYLLVYISTSVLTHNNILSNAKILRLKDQLNQDLEREVISRTTALEESLNSKNYFLNNVSHEIKTPVQVVTNICANLLENWKKTSEEDKLKLMKQLSYSGSNLFSLINDVLDISKFNSGKMLFDMKINNIENTVRNIVHELIPLSTSQGVEIDVYKKKHIETRSMFDSGRISQVVRNLLANAIEYSESGDRIRIDIQQKYASLPSGITINGLCVSIKDQGSGISKKDLKKIFEPFSQSSKNKYTKGNSGLGLYISSEIVSAHNGLLWAESNINGQGATFHCVIPYPNNLVRPDEDKSSRKKYNILFVDDEEGCRIAGRMLLDNLGYNVKTFNTGQDLLDYMKYTEKKIDLILLDILMPDIGGIEIVKILRTNAKYKNTPIVLQTGTKYDIDTPEMLKRSPIGYIAKPYNKEELNIEIEKFLMVSA